MYYNYKWEKSIVLNAISMENSKTLKYHTFLMKQYFFLLFAANMVIIMKEHLEKKKVLRY